MPRLPNMPKYPAHERPMAGRQNQLKPDDIAIYDEKLTRSIKSSDNPRDPGQTKRQLERIILLAGWRHALTFQMPTLRLGA
jgi:hypothetical protein